jgi:hypothetical protein
VRRRLIDAAACFKADARLHGSSIKTPFKDAITSKDAGMISLSEACRRAASYASSIETEEEIDVAEAQGRVLAHDIDAQLDLPPFDEAATDGYAFAASSLSGQETVLTVISRVAAGCSSSSLPIGTAARIFTGARVPKGADSVGMQERVRRDGQRILVEEPVGEAVTQMLLLRVKMLVLPRWPSAKLIAGSPPTGRNIRRQSETNPLRAQYSSRGNLCGVVDLRRYLPSFRIGKRDNLLLSTAAKCGDWNVVQSRDCLDNAAVFDRRR